jgi:hypothetical protein
MENPLWGAPRIHGELLKLGFEVAQSSVAKYMVKRQAPPSQGWRTFLRNEAPDIAAMDLFVGPREPADIALHHQACRLRVRCRENRCSLEVNAICSLAVDLIFAAPAQGLRCARSWDWCRRAAG